MKWFYPVQIILIFYSISLFISQQLKFTGDKTNYFFHIGTQ
jgi:hypothetical protein